MRLPLAIACSRAFDSRYIDDLLGFGGIGDHLEACRPRRAARRDRAPRPAVEGSASRIWFADDRRTWRGLCRRPVPQMKKSPTRSVPFCTSTVATGPRPRSSLASSTVPTAGPGRVRLADSAFRSRAESSRAADRGSACVLAETGTMTVSPPQSSASRPRSESCCLMRSGWASGLSILLIATMIGTFGGSGVVDRFEGLRHDAVVGAQPRG